MIDFDYSLDCSAFLFDLCLYMFALCLCLHLALLGASLDLNFCLELMIFAFRVYAKLPSEY